MKDFFKVAGIALMSIFLLGVVAGAINYKNLTIGFGYDNSATVDSVPGGVDLKDNGDISANGDLYVDGNITTESDLTVGGDITFDGSVDGNMTVTGNTTVSGDLTVLGSSTLTGDVTYSGDVIGDINVDGSLTVNGETLLFPDDLSAINLQDLGNVDDTSVASPNSGDVLTWSQAKLKWLASPNSSVSDVNNLSELEDVDLTGILDSYILGYDAGLSKWFPVPYVNSLEELEGIDLNSVDDGDVLIYNEGTSNFESVDPSVLSPLSIFDLDDVDDGGVVDLTGYLLVSDGANFVPEKPSDWEIGIFGNVDESGKTDGSMLVYDDVSDQWKPVAPNNGLDSTLGTWTTISTPLYSLPRYLGSIVSDGVNHYILGGAFFTGDIDFNDWVGIVDADNNYTAGIFPEIEFTSSIAGASAYLSSTGRFYYFGGDQSFTDTVESANEHVLYETGSPFDDWQVGADWPVTDGVGASEGDLFRHTATTADLGNGEYIYVIGGRTSEGVNDNIYRFDGTNWVTLAPIELDPYDGVFDHISVAYQPSFGDTKIYIISGNGDDLSPTSNVYTLGWDGANYRIELIQNAGEFGSRYLHMGAVHDNHLWILGGIDSDGNALGDTWKSSDGITWENVSTEFLGAFKTLYGGLMYSNGGRLNVLGGKNGAGQYFTNIAWTQTGSWNYLIDNSPWSGNSDLDVTDNTVIVPGIGIARAISGGINEGDVSDLNDDVVSDGLYFVSENDHTVYTSTNIFYLDMDGLFVDGDYQERFTGGVLGVDSGDVVEFIGESSDISAIGDSLVSGIKYYIYFSGGNTGSVCLRKYDTITERSDTSDLSLYSIDDSSDVFEDVADSWDTGDGVYIIGTDAVAVGLSESLSYYVNVTGTGPYDISLHLTRSDAIAGINKVGLVDTPHSDLTMSIFPFDVIDLNTTVINEVTLKITKKASLPLELYGHRMIAVDDTTILVYGGETVTGSKNGLAYFIDTTTNDFTISSSDDTPSIARSHCLLVDNNGELFILGGEQEDGSPLDDIWTSSDGGITWLDTGSTLTEPLARCGLVSFDGKWYIIGGEGSSGYNGNIYVSNDLLSWTLLGSSIPINNVSSVIYGGVAYLWGDVENNVVGNDPNVYVWAPGSGGIKPVNETVSGDFGPLTNILGHAVTAYNNKIFVYGGKITGSDPVEYNPHTFVKTGAFTLTNKDIGTIIPDEFNSIDIGPDLGLIVGDSDDIEVADSSGASIRLMTNGYTSSDGLVIKNVFSGESIIKILNDEYLYIKTQNDSNALSVHESSGSPVVEFYGQTVAENLLVSGGVSSTQGIFGALGVGLGMLSDPTLTKEFEISGVTNSKLHFTHSGVGLGDTDGVMFDLDADGDFNIVTEEDGSFIFKTFRNHEAITVYDDIFGARVDVIGTLTVEDLVGETSNIDSSSILNLSVGAGAFDYFDSLSDLEIVGAIGAPTIIQIKQPDNGITDFDGVVISQNVDGTLDITQNEDKDIRFNNSTGETIFGVDTVTGLGVGTDDRFAVYKILDVNTIESIGDLTLTGHYGANNSSIVFQEDIVSVTDVDTFSVSGDIATTGGLSVGMDITANNITAGGNVITGALKYDDDLYIESDSDGATPEAISFSDGLIEILEADLYVHGDLFLDSVIQSDDTIQIIADAAGTSSTIDMQPGVINIDNADLNINGTLTADTIEYADSIVLNDSAIELYNDITGNSVTDGSRIYLESGTGNLVIGNNEDTSYIKIRADDDNGPTAPGLEIRPSSTPGNDNLYLIGDNLQITADVEILSSIEVTSNALSTIERQSFTHALRLLNDTSVPLSGGPYQMDIEKGGWQLSSVTTGQTDSDGFRLELVQGTSDVEIVNYETGSSLTYKNSLEEEVFAVDDGTSFKVFKPFYVGDDIRSTEDIVIVSDSDGASPETLTFTDGMLELENAGLTVGGVLTLTSDSAHTIEASITFGEASGIQTYDFTDGSVAIFSDGGGIQIEDTSTLFFTDPTGNISGAGYIGPLGDENTDHLLAGTLTIDGIEIPGSLNFDSSNLNPDASSWIFVDELSARQHTSEPSLIEDGKILNGSAVYAFRISGTTSNSTINLFQAQNGMLITDVWVNVISSFGVSREIIVGDDSNSDGFLETKHTDLDVTGFGNTLDRTVKGEYLYSGGNLKYKGYTLADDVTVTLSGTGSTGTAIIYVQVVDGRNPVDRP